MGRIKGEYFPDDFLEYAKNNKEIVSLFCKFAKQAKDAGHKRYSHWLIANRIRWESEVVVRRSKYKISNNHIRHMARLLEVVSPEFKGFFKLKSPSRAEQMERARQL